MSGAELAGVITGCVGAATGLGALIVAGLGERRARKAERRSAEATAGAASIEVSLELIAENLRLDRETRERELTARLEHLAGRPQMGLGIGAAVLIAPPSGPPQFHLEYVRGHTYRLRNVSPVTATNVHVAIGRFPASFARSADGTVDLAPMAATETFPIAGNPQQPPGAVTVSCAELTEPVVVPLP